MPKIEKLDFHTVEAINILRGNIQMAGYGLKLIAFTSASPNEGKSTISFRLARSLAALDRKTLFLDADIRNSKIKQEYGIAQKTVGLSEYLCGLCKEEDMIYETDHPYLHIIFSGKRSPNPSELLSEARFSDFLQRVKERYDYVIVDTPPADVVVDAALIAKNCDTTILVVKSCFTDRTAAVHTKKKLEASGVKLMGAVLNLADESKSRYGKYGYGKYGYGKYGYGKYGYGKYGKDGYGEEESAQ